MSASPADGLLAAARALVPLLRERAEETVRLRRLPDATDRLFRDAGFYRVLQPARQGGLELDYGTQTDIAATLARGCVSSAWVMSILAAHGWMMGMFPDAAQREVWGGDPTATIATSFLPDSPAIAEVEGGLRLTGRWRFSSGVDLCTHAILLVVAPPGPARAESDPLFALLPRADYRIEDTWHASALAGTGSNDIVVADAFVPAHRIVRILELRGAGSPGSAVNPGYLYRLPLFAVFPFCLIGPALGGALGAVETLADGLATRTGVGRSRLAEIEAVRLRLAEATAAAHAATDMLVPIRAEIVADARAGRVAPVDRRAHYRLALSFAARLAAEATDRAMALTGARGLLAGNPIERAWRDVHAIGQHIGLAWDVSLGLYGAARLGVGAVDPKV